MDSSNITYPEIEGNTGNRSALFSRTRCILLEALQIARYRVQRQRTRNRLLQLDSDQLYDVGLSRKEAIEEGRKPFWK
jgi:uncharacterized protein YjiS (DUF1127 family)